MRRVWPLIALVLATLAAGTHADVVRAAEDPEWLRWLNLYRSIGDLAPVTHDPSFDAGVTEHARYLVDLDPDGLCTGYPHCEAIPPGTAIGDSAARNVISQSSDALSEREVVEGLIAAPFHALSMLRPGLTRVGYGSYTNLAAQGTFKSAGIVDVASDDALTDVSNVVVWPADGAEVPLAAYSGNESPDPLVASSCADLDFPTSGSVTVAGLPILVMNVPDGAVTASLTRTSDGEEMRS